MALCIELRSQNITHVCKGQVFYFLLTDIMSIIFTADGKVLFQSIEYTGDVNTIINNFHKIERDLEVIKELKYRNAEHKKYGTVVYPRKYATESFQYMGVNQDGSLNELSLNYRLTENSFGDINVFLTKPYTETLELIIKPECIEILVLSKASSFNAEITNTWKCDISEETSLYRALKLSEDFIKTLPGYEVLYADYLNGTKWLDNCFLCGKSVGDCACDFTKRGLNSGFVLSTNDNINDEMLDATISFLQKKNVKTNVFRSIRLEATE